MSTNADVHATADVSPSARLGSGVRVWHYAQVREDAVVGSNSIIGRGAYIGTGVELGENCKVQNYALVYEPARLARGVFVGPAVVFTNDEFPRAINPNGSQKSPLDWKPQGVTVLEGASIGAQSVCIAPVTIGRWALVGAGSVVSKDVPDFALVVGNPARRVGWVGHEGIPLVKQDDDVWVCESSGRHYQQSPAGELTEMVNG